MYLFIVTIIAMIIYMCVDLKKSLHMLQQNWYNDGNRYLKWINNNSKFVFCWFDFLYIIIFLFSLIFNNTVISIIFTVYYLIIAYLLRSSLKQLHLLPFTYPLSLHIGQVYLIFR